LCLSQARTWISNILCHDLYLMFKELRCPVVAVLLAIVKYYTSFKEITWKDFVNLYLYRGVVSFYTYTGVYTTNTTTMSFSSWLGTGAKMCLIVRSVDISGIVDHHYLNILFIIENLKSVTHLILNVISH
jgi:hypothetical protein